jgi:hypothetical protein
LIDLPKHSVSLRVGQQEISFEAPLAARWPAAARNNCFSFLPGTCSSARATRLGTVPGYYQPSRAARDWIAPFTMTIQEGFSVLSRENALMPYLSL